MSAISEVNNFLSRKAYIPTKRIVVKEKGGNSVPVKWAFQSKEEANTLIHLKLINVVRYTCKYLELILKNISHQFHQKYQRGF